MSSVKIGVISDTHGLLRSQAKQVLQGCELIIHAGDFDTRSVLDDLEAIAPTIAVRGNMDWDSWANQLKPIQRMQVGDWSIVVVHNIQELQTVDSAQIVVFGHSHKFLEEWRAGVLYLNPGSAGPRRFSLPITMAVLTLADQASVEKINLKNQA